ncbi:MAG: Ldh family oxidoreductase, partial [Chloroflexi bacterium]|nr:Ldh family oxidoreductase [Chloroflexota bacterium]
MPTVPPDELRRYLGRIFEAVGAPLDDAREVAAHLVEANLKGHDSHGVIRTAPYVLSVQEARVRPAAPIEVERET